jgi:hypothetical protein
MAAQQDRLIAAFWTLGTIAGIMGVTVVILTAMKQSHAEELEHIKQGHIYISSGWVPGWAVAPK